jgi:hypothetical protein
MLFRSAISNADDGPARDDVSELLLLGVVELPHGIKADAAVLRDAAEGDDARAVATAEDVGELVDEALRDLAADHDDATTIGAEHEELVGADDRDDERDRQEQEQERDEERGHLGPAREDIVL